MLPEQIRNFRQTATLRDGAYVLLRAMVTDDEARLREFYAAVSDEDLRFFRHRVKDATVIHEWATKLDYSRVLPLLALVKDRVVGSASLHFLEDKTRGGAEIRLYLAKDFRHRGLGTKMLRTLIDLARKHDLDKLTVEVVADEANIIKALEALGFQPTANRRDGFVFPSGEAHDLAILTMPLHAKTDEF